MVGTLFDKDNASSWNLNRLDSLLNELPFPIPGVNSAMLYVGSWRAMFAFHTEDYNLYSINYLHTGHAKSWYSIPSSYKTRFETMAHSYFTTEQRECGEFLRHKTKFFSPSKLKECGIKVSTVLQEAGEFVITFPGAYHAG
jgi:jumonji domain-containing protein 2